MKSLIDLEKERLEWSLQTFPEATAISSLQHLKAEIKEIENDIELGIKNATEYADALGCLFDSAARNGISIEEVVCAFEKKLEINKNRKWKKNPDNTYSHI